MDVNKRGGMKAAVCREFGGPLTIEEVTLRETRKHEVLVKILACAVCHSDISFMEGAWGGSLPAVYGHEASGEILEVGDGVEDYSVGDKVLVTLIRACSECISCKKQAPVICEEPYDRMAQSPITGNDGPFEHGLSTGAFAEMALVHYSQIQKIPSYLSSDVAALLSCGVITGFGAVQNTAQIEKGSVVAVVGVGGVGLNSIQGARICGAERIIAVDIDESRLEQAREFGATDVVLADKTSHRTIRKLTGGRGVDYTFITVGAGIAYNSAFKYLAPKGEVIAVGMPPSDVVANWVPVNLAYMGQSIRGSKMGDAVLSKDIPFLIDLYEKGELLLDELITGTFPLEQINEAIEEVKLGKVRRNVIVFD